MRSTTLTLATLGVGAALMSRPAAAIEELVVYRTALPTAATVPALESLHQDMNAYVEALCAEQKARIDASLSRRHATEIRIAAAKIPTRG